MGSNAFDDEGFPNQETVLIKDGILVSYMSDYLEHLLTGFPIPLTVVVKVMNTFLTHA